MLNGKPLICVSADTRPHPSDNRRYLTEQHQTYTDAVYAAGGIPILTCDLAAEEMAQLCDGLLLTGGADIEPELYGEETLNATVRPMPKRTAFEKPLFEAFLKLGKPIFGICRGTQLINACMGGTLYQDLVQQKNLVHMDPELRHYITSEEGFVLHKLFGSRFKVNSTHHQAVKDVADGFHVTALSDDWIIEGMEHDILPIIAVQFHPERLTGVLLDNRTPDTKPLFEYFVNMVKDNLS